MPNESLLSLPLILGLLFVLDFKRFAGVTPLEILGKPRLNGFVLDWVGVAEFGVFGFGVGVIACAAGPSVGICNGTWVFFFFVAFIWVNVGMGFSSGFFSWGIGNGCVGAGCIGGGSDIFSRSGSFLTGAAAPITDEIETKQKSKRLVKSTMSILGKS